MRQAQPAPHRHDNGLLLTDLHFAGCLLGLHFARLLSR